MPARGHFILHSRFLPDLTAGNYEYRSKVTGTPFPTRQETTSVRVVGPRYTMPPDQILSTFPPANAAGAFADRLPQIVLKRRTLPWERNPEGGPGVSWTPWLALIVLAEGEGELLTAQPVASAVSQGVMLPDPSDRDADQCASLSVTRTVLNKIFPTRADLPYLTHVREVDINDTELAGGDDDGWVAVVLANRLPVMNRESGSPVRYLAVLVNLEGQLDALPDEPPDEDYFTLELAQDWTFYNQQERPIDHYLTGAGQEVSLSTLRAQDPAQVQALRKTEQHGSGTGINYTQSAIDGSHGRSLVDWSTATQEVTKAASRDDAQVGVRSAMYAAWQAPISAVAKERVYKFPALASWSFTSSDGASFETLMQRLDYGLLGTTTGEHLPRDPDLPPAPAVSPGAPTPPPAVHEATVSATGHLQLGHRTRRGVDTTAWYRGPLTPHPSKRDEPKDGLLPLAHSADQLRRVVPDGTEELGYAAAFEIGRLMALSQLSVVSSLLRFRSDEFGKARIRELVSPLLPIDLLTEVGPGALARLISHQLMIQIAEEPELVLGPPRPIVDPGRPLLAKGEERTLKEIIAEGLGLELARVEKVAAAVGYQAALAATEVPLVDVSREITDRVGIEVMTEALDQSFARGLVTAMGKRGAGPGPLTHVLRGQGPSDSDSRRGVPAHRDALDELIDGAPRFADADPDEP